MINSLGTAVFVTSLVFSIFATLAVAARLYCRRLLKKQSLMMDDWLIVTSWVLALSLSITLEWGVFHAGVGQPQQTLPPDRGVKYLKILYIAELFSTAASGISKLSVLTFYRRIFTLPSSLLAINVAIALAAMWTVAFTLAFMFDLVPVSLQWSLQPKRPDRLNVPIFIVCLSVTGLFLDLIIVALPLPILRRLHTSKKRKAKYYSFFLLWIFCCAAGAVKVAYSVKWWQYNNNIGLSGIGVAISEAAITLVMWALIESFIAITAACLPTLGSLFKKDRLLGQLIPRKGFRHPAGAPNGEMSNEKVDPAAKTAAGRREQPSGGSIERRKWRAMWRVIAGDGNMTSSGLGSSEPLTRPTGDVRADIRSHQSGGTEFHTVSTGTTEEALYQEA